MTNKHNPFDHFYLPLLKHWGKTHGLRSICELMCRHLHEKFQPTHIQLVIAHQAHWQQLLKMDETGIHYYYPPKNIDDDKHIPFHQIYRATRQQQPYSLSHNNYWRIFIPLERHSRIIGCLIIDFPANFRCSIDEFLLLGTLLASELDTGLMSETIQNEHSGRRCAERELKQTQNSQQLLLESLQSLHDISFLMWRTESLEKILFTAVDEGKKRLKIDRMAIFLFDDQKKIKGTYGTNIHGETVDESYFRSELHDHWFTSKTLVNKDYLVVQEDCQLFHDCRVIGFGWSAYVALWDEDTPIGWIACDNLISGVPFYDHCHQLLKQFAFIVSQHMVRIRAEEHLRHLNRNLEQRVHERTNELQQLNTKLEAISRTDPLTNIANRRVFDETYTTEWCRAQRHQLPISMLLLDVDLFKTYNDRYGHAAGDDCLKAITQTLSTIERRVGSIFARYGGEEFVLLLPGQDKNSALHIAKKAIETIHKLSLPRENGVTSNPNIVTLSIGVSSITPHKEQTAQSFFKQTDNALYQAKAEGRDRFMMMD